MNKKISIITVCYNESANIQRTIDSIVEQTWQNFEWIVIDGDSKDETVNILNKYKNRIDQFISEKDNGIYHAMNKGLSLASGDWLLFINGGDKIANNKVLENIAEDLNPKYAVIYGNLLFNDEDLKVSPNQNIREILYKTCIVQCSMFFNKAYLDKRNFTFDEKYKIASDFDLFCKIAKQGGKFKHINKLVASFFLDGISITQIDLTNNESKEIRKKHFNRIDYYLFEKEYLKKINHFIMVLTHPRYLAGWLKNLIIRKNNSL
nr:glycosyltransferase family 2 protein [uncultured Carboxylicivirga sp.]